jgi:hypothetical protein
MGTQASAADATWSHRFWGANTLWSTPGGQYVAAASSSVNVVSTGSYTMPLTAQLMSDLESWLADPATNHGWILIGTETDTTARRIHSRESSATGSRPRLTLQYSLDSDGGDAPLPLWSLLVLGSGLMWQLARRRHA